MAIARSDFKNDIKHWLTTVLKNENINDLEIDISGNSEKGDGYMGDIVFVDVSGVSENKLKKKLNLVLKLSKNSKVLRETSPMQHAFLNEIFVYEVIFPYFKEFQREKSVQNPFDFVTKCYGSIIKQDMELIVLENLKTIGYELWPKTEPLTRKHIDLVITEYAKFHATSLAIQLQRPNVIQEFADTLGDIFEKLKNTGDLNVLFGQPIDESYDLLKDHMDENVLAKWLDFKKQIDFIFGDMYKNATGIKVILHGDCWNNNFMFLHNRKKVPSKVIFLDWQASRYSSPILDLSYFIFSCVAPEDLIELDDILNSYHQSFIHQLEQLDIEDPESVYPLNQFLQEWKSYCKHGVMMTSLLMKIVSTGKDEVLDVGQMAEKGENFSHAFAVEIKNKDNFKRRIGPIIEYAVKHDLI